MSDVRALFAPGHDPSFVSADGLAGIPTYGMTACGTVLTMRAPALTVSMAPSGSLPVSQGQRLDTELGIN